MSIETNLNESPFFDDFDETKNFHRVLFRPGYAVQARELKQYCKIKLNDLLVQFMLKELLLMVVILQPRHGNM